MRRKPLKSALLDPQRSLRPPFQSPIIYGMFPIIRGILGSGRSCLNPPCRDVSRPLSLYGDVGFSFDLIPLTWATRGRDLGGRDMMLDGRAGRRVLRSDALALWFWEDGRVTMDSGHPSLILVTHQKKLRRSMALFFARSLLPIMRDPAGSASDRERRVTE